MTHKSFLIDVDKCTGCKLCIVACKDEHVGAEYAPWTKPQPDTGHFWIDVKELERGQMPRVRMSYLPVLCQHCADAPCIKACPEGAIKTRDDGLVWIDPAACNSCGLCQEACPYDVIYMNEELGLAQKCTGCAHRVDAGELPRCAEVCPHEAIVFGEAPTGEVFHPEYETAPRVAWKGLPKPWIAGALIDAADDEVVADATVIVTDLAADRAVTARSDAFGEFWLRGMDANRRYRIEIRKDGYDVKTDVLTTDRDRDLGTISLKRRA
jgi:Fe-S-cluster-containing dehydrogenase component